MNVRPGVSAGSLGEGGFGFSCWWCVLCVCIICVCMGTKGGARSLGDKGLSCMLYSKQTAVSALGQIYWPSNHGSQ